MITPNQQNLKVHFAAFEQVMFAQALGRCADVRYALCTVLPYIAHKVGVNAWQSGLPGVNATGVKWIQNHFEHTIMDSGLFSLMFGTHAGPRDAKFIQKWTDLIIEWRHEFGFEGTMVEVDCQKMLGAENAWKYREQMRRELPNRMINVFHLDDGQKGLDRLIEYSDYIAVSLPELRVSGKKSHAERLVNYIKNKKPAIDIHLLGCTEKKLLRSLRFATSSDSTAWQQVNRYGQLKYNNGKTTKAMANKHVDHALIAEKYGDEICRICAAWDWECTPKRVDYIGKYIVAGVLSKQEYTIHAGPQD